MKLIPQRLGNEQRQVNATKQRFYVGTRTTFTFDAADRLLSQYDIKIDDSVKTGVDYQYDPAGNRTYQMRDASGERTTWTYDDSYQLVREQRSSSLVTQSFDTTFTYDPTGNHLVKSEFGALTTSTFDVANQLQSAINSSGTTTYTFDAAGEDVGKLGQELEAMPLLVYNGKMYGGTLPSAEVYRYDGDMNWMKVGCVDRTPDAKYRRAWSMAVFQGRLFVGTLPGGRVLSIEAGRNATWDRELSAGWHHVAAVRSHDRLQLYVDGKLASESAAFAPEKYDLTNRQPLRIGLGAQDYFLGDLADVRLYRGALSPEQVRELSSKQH